MAIAFTAGTSVEGTGSATTTTVTLPSGLADGDYTIIFISVNASSANITTPSGWTAILPDTNSANGSTSMAHACFYRKWVSGDGNVTVSHSSGRAAATPVKVTGADTTTFVNTAASVTQASSGAVTIVAPSITPSSTTLVSVFAGRDANNGDVLDPWTNLSAGLTKIAEANGRAATQTNAGHCIAYQVVTANSATGTRQADAAQATTGAFGFSFALNEGSSDPPGEASVELSGTGTLTAARVYEGDTTFDGGTIEDWTDASSGDGTVTVTDLAAHDGANGIEAVTPTSNDKAALTKTIGPTQKARVSAWWRVTVEGSSGSNVPFVRIFYGTQRLADVYRQNDAGGAIWLRIVKAAGGANYWFINTGATTALDEWVYVEFEWDLTTGAPLVKINGVTYLDSTDTPTDWFDAPEINRVYLGSHESGNAGTWQMDTVTVEDFLAEDYNASANFSGSGTLTSSQTLTASSSASLSGSGTLSSSRIAGASASGSFSGSGTLSATSTAARSASAALSGTGTLSSTNTPAVSRNASLSGTGTLTGSASTDVQVTGVLSGEGTLEGVTDETTASTNVNLSGTGTLTRTAVANFTASMSSTGEGMLTISEVHAATNAVATFSGSGTLSSTGTPAVSKSVALSGSGTLSSTQSKDVAIGVDLSGTGTLSTEFSNSFTRDVALSGTGTLSATTTPALNASAALSGSGTLTGGTSTNKSVTANLSASGALQPFLTSVNMKPSASFSGSGTLTGSGVKGNSVSVAFSGTGTLGRLVQVHFSTLCNRDGNGVLVADAVATRSATAVLSGVGTLTATPDTRHDYTFTAELASKRWNADVGLKRWEGSL